MMMVMVMRIIIIITISLHARERSGPRKVVLPLNLELVSHNPHQLSSASSSSSSPSSSSSSSPSSSSSSSSCQGHFMRIPKKIVLFKLMLTGEFWLASSSGGKGFVPSSYLKQTAWSKRCKTAGHLHNTSTVVSVTCVFLFLYCAHTQTFKEKTEREDVLDPHCPHFLISGRSLLLDWFVIFSICLLFSI